MAAKANKRGKKGANGYKLPEAIPQGEILQDLSKNKWIIGKSIGVGGFGEIYSASIYTEKSSASSDFSHVIKIEPHVNGPLFVEMHFYMRNAKSELIDVWKKKKKLRHLGMPKFIASGSHEYKGTKYRFLVMDRYGTDLWHLFLDNTRYFSEATVYKIAIQVIDVLEYIHSRSYVHADIKGANLLMDRKSLSQVYLVDFGLATKITQATEYKVDPKRAHNGTIEYTSRDAHMGIPTMRGDLEILGYNIVQWLAGELPWEKNMKDPKQVQDQKLKAFNNLDGFLKNAFKKTPPASVSQYFQLLDGLRFKDEPSYQQFRAIFEKALAKLGEKVDSNLKFGKASSKDLASAKQISASPAAKATTKDKEVGEKAATKRLKKTLESPARRSPRVRKKSPDRLGAAGLPSLDESTVGVVVDKKREKLKNLKMMLDTIDDDSETEYDIQIFKKTKKRKSSEIDERGKSSEEEKKKSKATTIKGSRKVAERRPRKKIVEHNSDSENDVTPRKTKTRVTRKKPLAQRPSTESDEDIFA